MPENNYPKLHNATWPGIVGKGPDSEPVIPFDTMLKMTAAAEVDGVKFDGVDIGLFDPHIDLDMSDDGIKALADKVGGYGLSIGSLVAPIWGGPAMGSKEERATFVEMVRKACVFGKKLNDLGIRKYGVVRIDSASKPEAWAQDPAGNTKLIAQTFREACDVAADFGESLAAEGEICWGGMHSWKAMIDTMEAVERPNIGFQADMSHTLLYLLGYNSPEDRILPVDFDWNDRATLDAGLKKLTAALRPWTIDFHVAQNDGTVHGQGSHDKTGRHCLATDPNGKLDIAHHAGFWLRDENGDLTKRFKHICWDGCMFPNPVMENQQTWNDILAALIKVRNAHGWVA
ncbi:sugar phosphate isomerase/epimerase family protein [Dyadobacter sp. MSC1_007]|jgi:sugar phosphate isomerase/epimerase|uniref:sugar phosphate isomerase/epimerase family protein n=1 Tax=Dyadobacter sp. MSC1_007 TaxID=2909264 RepID=UPI00202DE928|nr:TIM barrel protein [Dyadobacter sp. MSC1_007]